MSYKLGLIINPIAGVGAELAWKGTDDVMAAWLAIASGSNQPIWSIVQRALKSITKQVELDWYLGGDYPLPIKGKIIHRLPSKSTAEDTKIAVRRLIENQVDLIIFAGGDGTASDIAKISGNTPIIGIPGGVKIFSPCFLHRPEDLGNFLANWDRAVIEVDILDLDEDAYREGKALPKLISSALIPQWSAIQRGKESWPSSDDGTFELIAERITEENWIDQTLMIGPGSTMKNIFHELDLELSLLGVDIVKNGEIIVLDGNTEVLSQYKIDELWLSPIGNQGHILGRGNKQIPKSLLYKVSKAQLKIFSTLDKIRNTPKLYVDCGDPELDRKFRGFYSVFVGYHEEILRKAE